MECDYILGVNLLLTLSNVYLKMDVKIILACHSCHPYPNPYHQIPSLKKWNHTSEHLAYDFDLVEGQLQAGLVTHKLTIWQPLFIVQWIYKFEYLWKCLQKNFFKLSYKFAWVGFFFY